jgi:hypothetical protein
MQQENIRLTLINEYESAPDTALFSQLTLAALRQCSIATIERDRWAGTGVPFIKIGRLVRYRKSDIHTRLNKHPLVQSTTQAQTCSIHEVKHDNNG